MNKMVINHLDKLFVTNDAATIVNELEVQHPAAKLLVLAGKAQQEEIGDGANLTISFAGELLSNAEELIRMGLHPSEIISGYTKAIKKVCQCFCEWFDLLVLLLSNFGFVLFEHVRQLKS
jgi:T-complex protein 1 subunit theta